MSFLSSAAHAQLEESINRYTGKNAEGFVKPLVSALGSNFNRGWYHSADLTRGRIYFYIGANAMAAYTSDEDRTYTATTEGSFTPVQTAEAPTIVGSTKTTAVSGAAGTQYVFPAGLNLDAILFATPQLTVGGFAGTEATLRFFTASSNDADFGEVNLLGLGIRHSISRYFPAFPVALTGGVFYQKLSVGNDLLDMRSLHFGFQASKKFSLLTVYGGVGIESSNAKVEYKSETDPNTNVSLDVDGDNGFQATVGASVKLAIINLNYDFSLGARRVVALGVGFEF
jgi:hypothetical protein